LLTQTCAVIAPSANLNAFARNRKEKQKTVKFFFHLLIKKQTATAAKKLNKIADSLKRPL
jgi:hypothetical protein